MPTLREAHSTPVTNMFADVWRTWVFQATKGFAVYNLASVPAPPILGRGMVPARPGCRASPTATTAAARSGSWPWRRPISMWPQADHGLNIYEFTDLADPGQVSLAERYPTSWFGHRVNPIWVRGNRPSSPRSRGITVSPPRTSAARRRWRAGLLRPELNPADPQRLWLDAERQQALCRAPRRRGKRSPGARPSTSWTRRPGSCGPNKEVAGQCSSGGLRGQPGHDAFIGLSNCVHRIGRDTRDTPSPSDDSLRCRISPEHQPNAW